MKSNKLMKGWLQRAENLVEIRVPSNFMSLVGGGIRKFNRWWLFVEYARPEHSTREELGDDDTGVECKTNDVYLSAQLDRGMASEAPALAATGLACARYLAKALHDTGGGPFRIIMSVRDDGTGKLRFHKVREGESWLAGDLDGYLEEGILEMDVT